MAMTTFKLYGKLGKEFGREHRLDCHTPAEGLTGLFLKMPGLQERIQTAHLDGMRFRVRKGGVDLPVDALHHHHAGRVITIAPVMEGAKNGFVTAIIGVVLIVASFYSGGLASAGYMSAATASSIGAGAFAMGVSMAMGGVMQMLSPQPKMQQRQDADNKPSYAFGGPVNTTQQGLPIGVLYGEREIGGHVISAATVAEDYNG